MPDYGNRSTKLGAPAYKWTATFARGPLRSGRNASQDCTGSYTTQPGATVGDLLDGLTAWWAAENSVAIEDVVLISYSLRSPA